jgi:hypothetical protein
MKNMTRTTHVRSHARGANLKSPDLKRYEKQEAAYNKRFFTMRDEASDLITYALHKNHRIGKYDTFVNGAADTLEIDNEESDGSIQFRIEGFVHKELDLGAGISAAGLADKDGNVSVITINKIGDKEVNIEQYP